MGCVERMVQHAIDIANDDSHGYSWADRWNVDRDCASLMYDSADAGGYPVGRGPERTRYTGTMIDDFTAAGFACYGYGAVGPYRGCIFLRDPWGELGHTEMYIGDGMNVGAHIAETGGVYGEPGDQTGNEISITPNYGNWDYILCPPEDTGESEEEDMLQPMDVWAYKNEDLNGNADAYALLTGASRNSAEAAAQVAALTEAVKVLAQSKGVDPQAVTNAVEKAVKERLSKLKLSIKAS